MQSKTKFDISSIRKDFPILNKKIYGKSLIYFDNAATSQKPEIVINTIADFYRNSNANVHRGTHFLSQESTSALEESRKIVKEFINANSTDEIIFTRGTTESINLVAQTFGELLEAGDEIIISTMEHHSNIVPWQILCERKKCVLKIAPISQNGEIIEEEFENLLNKNTKLVAISHISNSLGTINPIKKIIEKAHLFNSKVLIDGAQSIQHSKIDVQELDCDFFVFSGHKIYGPTGIGILYGKEELLEKLPPYQSGGEMISNVSFKKTTFNQLPYKLEAGTPNYVGAIALAEAIKYFNKFEINSINNYETELLNYAQKELMKIDGCKIIGQAQNKSAVISFNFDSVHHYDLGVLLDKQGIAVRTGHHCTQPLMEFFKIQGTVRASFAFYNTKEEIDSFIEAVKKSLKILR